MSDTRHAFDDYLTRHYAHLGDHAKHREGKKRQLRATYERWLPPNRDAAMLEIGPGYGQLIELLRRDLGYGNAVAVDVSREVVAFCERALPGSTAHEPDTLAFLRRHEGRFERVFALHVIEHVPRADVVELVGAMRDALVPGGRVLIEVPNMANLLTGAYLRWADFTHEAGYSETSLRQLLEGAGFAEVECFEERLPAGALKSAAGGAFRALARAAQRMVYRGYELPVPVVLTPAVCATAVRPRERA